VEADDYSDDPVVLGDMLLQPKQFKFIFSNDSSMRHGFSNSFNHWPKAQMSYTFASDLNGNTKGIVLRAMEYLSKVSCVRFKESKKGDYVLITNGKGCSSNVGNLQNGRQHLKLSPRCQLGNVVHEILHSLGFMHMHTAAERDSHVRIAFDNIQPAMMSNFKKYTRHVSMFNTPYDYGSIMHYPRVAFAKNSKKPTIIPMQDAQGMGQRSSKSRFDFYQTFSFTRMNSLRNV
jgi:Astacin (Peptidase family M12A)